MTVALFPVERLMRKLGLRGVMRGKVVRTTVGNVKASCPLDRVNRQFRAQQPDQLWVSDFTYVSTWHPRWQQLADAIERAAPMPPQLHALLRFEGAAEFTLDLGGIALPLQLGERQLAVLIGGPMFRIQPRRDELVRVMREEIAAHVPEAVLPGLSASKF